MTNYIRFLWGSLAGLAVIFVKMLGPDNVVVKALMMAGNQGEIAFYLLMSLVTIMLGGISGLFSRETEPKQILVFCAAFPALVSTASSPERVPAGTNIEYRAETNQPSTSALANISLVTAAYAQQRDANSNLACDEGGFLQQFNAAAKSYFGNDVQNNTYAVIIGSEQDFDKAKARADAFAAQSGKYRINVACHKPQNPYFPIMVGDSTDIQTASGIKGEIIGEGWAPSDTYISNYAYRTIIYQAQAQ